MPLPVRVHTVLFTVQTTGNPHANRPSTEYTEHTHSSSRCAVSQIRAAGTFSCKDLTVACNTCCFQWECAVIADQTSFMSATLCTGEGSCGDLQHQHPTVSTIQNIRGGCCRALISHLERSPAVAAPRADRGGGEEPPSNSGGCCWPACPAPCEIRMISTRQ
jgi:hypothetical protein